MERRFWRETHIHPASMEQGWRCTAAVWVLVLWASGSSQEGPGNLGTIFNSKAAYLLNEEPVDPKCFTQHLEDLACFWETLEPTVEQNNQSKYSFQYKYGDDDSLRSCNLTVEFTPANTTRYTCFFQTQDILAFIPLEIKVFDGRSHNRPLYNRTIFVEKLLFLDPPSNLTVQLLESPGQLNVSWHPPPVKHMDNIIRYEVAIFHKGSIIQRMEIASGQTYYFRKMKGGTHYTLAVRAKPNGISYDGYWSGWSQEVPVVIPSELDPLILTLSVILVLIVLLLAFITLMFNRRFLKKKVWPAIPTPEREFKDLFTIYKGNFQLWLGHQSTYLWWSQNSPYLDEQPFLVEILSECDVRKMDGPPPLPPKARGVVEPPHNPELSQDDYLVLDEDLVPGCLGRDGSLLLLDSDSSEDTDLALAAGVGTPEPSQASSSFEYTMFDPSSKSLSPWGHQAEPQLKSSYQMVSDSGISADYSLVDSNAGQMSLYTNLCDEGAQPFLPTYIVCS
ncbi:erythropoietin receptor [Rhineura floridana]|uniref:erythropoietin receptor n=1 Tax=Rhineura floridana TaxID=261503 RepID=UPI002AC87CFC|nr:erythropoietin receptor [Rhineura floridana]